MESYLHIMPNKLKNEQSPYLLQHASNPVAWYPWGDEAFDVARTENKPLIVSIGYAACHWCHVMEHESFEDEDTAAYMNEHFVCIKVDREEHPDVDHMYMDAVQAIGGSGGWPLNVFVTPDRAPFYGGTYYPPRPAYNRPSWMQLLERMTEIWDKRQDEVQLQAEQLIQHLRQASARTLKATAAESDMETARKIAENLLKQADIEKGGFGNAPKFPGTMAISFLLEHYHFTGYEPALKHALRSLDAMMEGGIYDQLAGGFARYSTDRDWLAPHFEKMLYDNALLICSLCDAYSVTGDKKYRVTAEETIAFAERELTDKTGGFYCAIDADSEGEEGKFYTWTWDEWIAAMWTNDEVAERYFGVKREGNWEGTNILHVARSIQELAAEHGLSEGEIAKRIAEAKRKLLAVRGERERPMTDDKSLLSWNALMNIALSKAGMALGEEKYIDRATEHMNWMLENFKDEDIYLHVWKNGVARIPAKLDDLAYLVQALLQLASAGGDNSLILRAAELTEAIIAGYDNEGVFFYYTAAQQTDIPVRKVDMYDGATPSANAVMAHNLWICGMCMEQTHWIARAEQMLSQQADTVVRYTYSFGYWAILLQRQAAGMKTAVIAGPGARAFQFSMLENYLPQAFLITLEKEIFNIGLLENKYFSDKMYTFVCSKNACLSPVSTVEAALGLISGK